MKIIIGLGNPGKEYEKTRHNVGFMVIEKFVEKMKLSGPKKKFDGLYFEYVNNNEKIIILKPQAYINLSGDVIKKYIDFFKIDIKDILVINDDLDLDLGKIKLKNSGGSGGHNGLKNIENVLGENNYKRLKIGIANNKCVDTRNYVLGKLTDSELEILDKAIEKSLNILMDYINIDFLEVMNKYNGDRV
jgi:peptidyl-tRNA hydrolase, PTH1 family